MEGGWLAEAVSVATILTGLASVGYGAYLAGSARVGGAVPTILAGLALIVISGPAAHRLGKFAVSEKGIEVTYLGDSAVANASAQQAQRVLATFVTAVGGENSDQQKERQAASVAKSYYAYISGLGFVPAPFVGSGIFKTGAVFVLKDGVMVLYATQQDAFPSLAIDRNPSGLGNVLLRSQTSETSASSLEISCQNGTAESTSLAALEAAANPSLPARMDAKRNYYVVTEVIACEQLGLLERASAGATDVQSNGSFEHTFNGHTIVGYRLALLKPLDATALPSS